MWTNVIGPGGARELLWLERQEGYARVFLRSYPLLPVDCMLVFSHGRLNAAPVEVALEARSLGLTVISVSSHENARAARPTHSSGKRLSDLAHIAIDNCVPPEDAVVDVGQVERVGAASTVAAVSIAMALVAETAAHLSKMGGGRRPSFRRMFRVCRPGTWSVCIRHSLTSITPVGIIPNRKNPGEPSKKRILPGTGPIDLCRGVCLRYCDVLTRSAPSRTVCFSRHRES